MVGLRIVGEHALDGDAALGIPGNRAPKEASAADSVAAGKELGVGQARVVVDRHVQVLPADASVAVRSASLGAEHALARFPEAAELLGVDMEELAWALTLVAAGTAGGSARSRSREQPWRRKTLPIVEGGCATTPARRTGP